MAELTGNEILARCLKAQGVKDMFFIMGGPMLDAELCSIKEGIRLIDTRHEQGAHGAGLFAGDPGAGRVHGGERPGDPELRHRPRQCADRWLPGRGPRRLEPDQPVRPPSVPGNRPGQGARWLRQVLGPRPQPEAPAAAGELRVSEGAGRQARPGLSRFPRRRALHHGRGSRGRLELYGPADHQGASLCRAQGAQRARRRDRRGASRSSSRAAVCSGRTPGTR